MKNKKIICPRVTHLTSFAASFVATASSIALITLLSVGWFNVALAAETKDDKGSGNVSIWDAFDNFSESMKTRLPYFIAAAVIIVLSFLLAKFASILAERALNKSTKVHRTAFTIIAKSVYIGALVIGFTLALKIAGMDISFIVGAATFGLGFAMKDLIENYISGVIIVLQEPFHVGDMVEVEGQFGWVEEIQARVTFIKSIDGQRIIVPNSHMIQQALTNFSSFQQRRLAVGVGVSYDTDLKTVTKIIEEVMEADDEVLKKPSTLVLLKEFADSAIILEARFWIDQEVSHWMKVPSKIGVKIKQALDAANINIPFPIVTLAVNEHDSGDLVPANKTVQPSSVYPAPADTNPKASS